MKTTPGGRADTASRTIHAPVHRIYEALLDESAIMQWRPPKGMSCEIYHFEPHLGGRFRMAFRYHDHAHNVRGKTSSHLDVFHGRFLALTPNERVVEEVEFETDDPSFKGKMLVTTELHSAAIGTEVRITCTDVPAGIRPEDHQTGMTSTLENLAAFVERV